MKASDPIHSIFSPQEREKFCIGENKFPKTGSQLKEFIFLRTGYSADSMDWRGWYCLNYSLNEGLDIGLPVGGKDRTLLMLSLIDHALGQVPRFVGVAHMPPMRTDSTAAHCKQVMNIVQTVFENSEVFFGKVPRPGVNQLRRDALLGAWIHDMGEVIFELTTADDMHALAPDMRQTIQHQKNALEEKIFVFACQLAIRAIEQNDYPMFINTIRAIRAKAISASQHSPNPEKILIRISEIQSAIEEVSAQYSLDQHMAPETEQLLRIYRRTEEKGEFLHPFVKTLEAVEGQRYLQRNNAEAPTSELSRLLHPVGGYPYHPQYEWSSDYDIISSIHRAERRLPELFSCANQTYHKSNATFENSLARAAANFTYRSIARQFLPDDQDYVGLAPEIINRAAVKHERNDPVFTADPQGAYNAKLAAERPLLDAQPPQDVNVQYYSRRRAGLLYRAAERMVGKSFFPKSECLIRLSDTPEIPESLARDVIATESRQGNVVRLINSGSGQHRR